MCFHLEQKNKQSKKMIPKMLILYFFLNIIIFTLTPIDAQDYDAESKTPPAAEIIDCNGIYVAYTFMSRTKLYPYLKNVTAQPWGFKSTVTVLNAGLDELKAWKIFVGFQHHEILVSASNAVIVDGDDLPAPVGNGTSFSGYPLTDLKTSVETAGDLTQIQAEVELTGTQFGIMPPGNPMPRTIKLVNDGYKCPAPKHTETKMHMCCVRDKKSKVENLTTKYFPRQQGDLLISYDVLQAYETSYLAQVTMVNKNPLGRLDQWNLTWEWMRGEFISSMRGAYTRKRDITGCIFGNAAQYYTSLDFSKVMNCEKKPVIADLPVERADDKETGNLPYCCRNGTLLPTTMSEPKSTSIFQLQVNKIPPALNRTALHPPERWKIEGVLNPQYKCGPPLRVDETEFPDSTGLQSTTSALATWQIVCNITRPKPGQSRCCVSYSAYYNESVIPCNTCACGCDEDNSSKKCNPKARILLPPEAILLPYENRVDKAVAWAKIKHRKVPIPLPCPDNCGVSVNWHVASNYRGGFSARVTLFNWGEMDFADWFVAVQLNKTGPGFQRAYSFNGTVMKELGGTTVFLTGLPGLNYLIGETNGSKPDRDPRVPGKQQSVLTFTKKHVRGVEDGDVFPTRLFFNGEECALPKEIPRAYAGRRYEADSRVVALVACATFFWLTCCGNTY